MEKKKDAIDVDVDDLILVVLEKNRLRLKEAVNKLNATLNIKPEEVGKNEK